MNRRITRWSPKRWTNALLRASLAVLPASQLLSAQSVELRRKYRDGDDYRYVQTQSTRSVTPMGDITQTMSTTTRETVLRVAADGAVTVRLTQESIQIKQNSAMGQVEYDSRTGVLPDPSNPVLVVMAALAGKSFEVTLGADGRPVSSSAADQMRDEIVASIAASNPALATSMRTALRNASVENLVGAGNEEIKSFPASPVAPGAQWIGETSFGSSMGTTRMKNTYTLRSLASEAGRPVAHIDVHGTVVSEVDPSSAAASLMSGMSGETTGELIFDVDRGVMLRSTSSGVVTVNVMGQSLRSESTSTTELIP